MTSKNVFVGNWSYIMPDTKANSNGRIVLIKKLSFGPCEVYEWGIDNNGLPYEESCKRRSDQDRSFHARQIQGRRCSERESQYQAS